MSPSPGGGHYVSFEYWRFNESQQTLSICAQSRTHPEGLALFLVNTKQPTNMGTNKQDKQPNN